MNPEQWLSLKWNGGSTMSDRWLNQSKIIQCILKIEQESIDKGLGDYFVYKYLELNDGSCIAQIDISCIILKTWPKKISCVDVTKEVDQMLEKNRCS